MQHKRRMFSLKKCIALLVVLVIGGFASLSLVTIPAPQKPIEKELDAKAFIEQKVDPK